MLSIARNLDAIQAEIGDRPVCLIVVSKSATVEQIEACFALGVRDFAENRLQDFLSKFEALSPACQTESRWHLIGHLQRNKIQKTLKRFALIHSVDTLPLAQKLSEANMSIAHRQDILLQVNISGEHSKFGFSPEDLSHAFAEIIKLPGIHVKGLMTIAPKESEKNRLHSIFLGLNTLKGHLEHQHDHPLPELSMGMSEDYVQAMACGATMIRIGRTVFSE